jgi:hypothetical protein
MTPVLATEAQPDGKEPVGVSVSISPLHDTVIIHHGIHSVGLSRADGKRFAQHFVAALETLERLANAEPGKQ